MADMIIIEYREKRSTAPGWASTCSSSRSPARSPTTCSCCRGPDGGPADGHPGPGPAARR
ncbi:MAG: hypothetical protein R3F43_29735 [bacterium]